MRKLTKLLLSIMLMATICLLVPSAANAENIKKYTWNGFVYTKDDVPWKEGDINILSYKGSKKNLTIPSEIKGLKVAYVYSLGKSKSLESVHISDDVEVKEGVLSECPNLKKVTISKNNPDYIVKNKMLLSKDGKTVVDCPGDIKNPKIPDSVTTIAQGAFSGSGMKKITLGENITYIDAHAFQNCKKLEEINFHEDIGIKYIDYGTFHGCKSLKFIQIPDSVIGLYDDFYGCTSLETIITGKNLKEMSGISECSNLKAVYFYNEDCKIMDADGRFVINEFSKCADKVTLYGFGDSAVVKGAKKFGIKYEVMEEITCHNAKRSGDFEYLVSSAKTGNTAIITAYMGTEEKLTIPTQIEGIPVKKVNSLSESMYLKEITIPDGITIKGGVLSSCPNLQKISVSSENIKYSVKNKMLLSKDGKTLLACPGGLTKPQIPSDVTKLADRAFMGSSISKITLGKNITTMGSAVFKNCKQLATVKFHKNIKVKEIKNSVFENCKSLKTMELPNRVHQIWNNVFNGCTKLKTVKIQKNLNYLGFGLFTDCKNLQSIYIYSKNCVIADGSDSLIDSIYKQENVTIYGKKGSTVEEKADGYMCITFKLIK